MELKVDWSFTYQQGVKLHYSDSWGDFISVTMIEHLGCYSVTQRFGDAVVETKFWRWGSATDAYDEAVINAELLVDTISNGIPSPLTWPPE